MAKLDRAALKAFFETGDKPTQAQFADLIDSYVNITDDLFLSSLTFYVSPDGDNAEGEAGNINKPFKTLTAAKNAAVAFSTIIVLPGTYDENDLLKTNVNWNFLNGAIINSTIGDQTIAIFDSSVLVGGYQGKITGYGIFNKNSDASFKGIVFANNDADDFFIEALEMDSKGNTTIWVEDIAGTAKVNVLVINKANSDGGTPFYSANGILNVRCDEAIDSTDAAVIWSDSANAEINAIINKANGFFNCTNGILNINFNTVTKNITLISNGIATIIGNKADFNDGTIAIDAIIQNIGGTLKYNVKETTLINASTPNNRVALHQSGKTFIIGRLVNLLNNEDGILVSGAGLILQDVEIITTGAGSESINAGLAQNIKVYQGVANKAVNINITELVNSLTIDANVE